MLPNWVAYGKEASSMVLILNLSILYPIIHSVVCNLRSPYLRPVNSFYVSVSLENLSMLGYIGAISIVEGAEGALDPRCSLRDSSSRTSPNTRRDMFCPSKCRSRKSPTWKGCTDLARVPHFAC